MGKRKKTKKRKGGVFVAILIILALLFGGILLFRFFPKEYLPSEKPSVETPVKDIELSPDGIIF